MKIEVMPYNLGLSSTDDRTQLNRFKRVHRTEQNRTRKADKWQITKSQVGVERDGVNGGSRDGGTAVMLCYDRSGPVHPDNSLVPEEVLSLMKKLQSVCISQTAPKSHCNTFKNR
ncbi:hypothetical protein T265_10614 [Opisthorchis viverrini]|uniref:Uncharacterized protein n=1 Tax=Opisthorchis viverrini TaxID=6198 RepID=A0A074Z1V1_OPIVI|nr:hypothetical protein T265_10614 [Opisthorchis viverrini]KER20958.1 hypothetical protein T265_10614 [Opisthorchis viverrini]